MRFNRAYPLFGIVLACLLILGLCVNPGLSQSRRQPPTSNEKKNQRPGQTPTKEGEQEPLPRDLEPTKPQDLEKVSISTQIVNIDAVVYHKKSGQIVTGLKKPNFAIFADGPSRKLPTSRRRKRRLPSRWSSNTASGRSISDTRRAAAMSRELTK